jgi:Tfp pilus assembly protein PilV
MRTAHPPTQRRRSAFTLLELLVACFVLGTGVLALASTAVAVARLTGDAARAGSAAERGQGRVEAMRASHCAGASGTLVEAGITEWWTATSIAAGEALSDSVRFSEGAKHALRTESLASAAWCT